MKCFDCESGRLSRKAAKVPHEVRGLKFEVEDSVWVCNKCGAISIPPDRLKEHGRLVDEAYRRLADILTVEEIKAARHRLRMSQRQFAEYLGVGGASVKRWETGVLPDKSSSDLIRLKTDPAAARANYKQLEQLLSLGKPESGGVKAQRAGARATSREPAGSVSAQGEHKVPRRSSARL